LIILIDQQRGSYLCPQSDFVKHGFFIIRKILTPDKFNYKSMQCFLCEENPVLVKIGEETPACQKPIKKSTPTGCYGCGKKINLEQDEYHHCKKCDNYSICQNCRLCNNGHSLIKTIFLSKIANGYSGDSFVCNICRSNEKTTISGIWHCTACEYDACTKCLK